MSAAKLALSITLWTWAALLLAGSWGRYYASRIQKEQTLAQYEIASRPELREAAPLGDYERKLERAIRLDPTNNQLYMLLGNIHFMQGRVDRSIQDFTRALLLRKDPRTLLNLGETYRVLGDRTRAELCFNEALKYDPYDPHAREALNRLNGQEE